MYAVPLIFRRVKTTRFNTFPSMPRPQIMGRTIPYDNFLRFSVLRSFSDFVHEKKMKMEP